MYEEWGGIDPLSTLQPGQTYTIGAGTPSEQSGSYESWVEAGMPPTPYITPEPYAEPELIWPAPGAQAPPEELITPEELPEGFTTAPGVEPIPGIPVAAIPQDVVVAVGDQEIQPQDVGVGGVSGANNLGSLAELAVIFL